MEKSNKDYFELACLCCVLRKDVVICKHLCKRNIVVVSTVTTLYHQH